VTPAECSAWVKDRAAALGFARTGFAPLERNPHAAELDRWLTAGHAGTMTYLHRQAEKRKDPRRIMPGARVAVVTLTNYFHEAPRLGRGGRAPPGGAGEGGLG
jgi:epoxyqueuosine reductase